MTSYLVKSKQLMIAIGLVVRSKVLGFTIAGAVTVALATFGIAGETKSLSTSVAGKGRVERSPAQEQRDWPVYGGAAENNHYSVLKQINRSNVKQLALAWSFDSQEEGGLQTGPIVAEGVLYGIFPDTEDFRPGRHHRKIALEV